MAALAVAEKTPIEQKTWQFESKSGKSAGHEVRLHVAEVDGSLYLTCTCPGGKYAWAGDATGRGCWAMKAVRQAIGLA